MKRMLTIVAAGATLLAGVVSATGVRAARPAVTASGGFAGACTPGTWIQTPANVTPAMKEGELLGVTIVSATDAWAVGYHTTPTSPGGSLWEHWTGGSSWSVVSSGGRGVTLDAVTNFGPDDVWAAGQISHGGNSTALISMWNGTNIVRATIPRKGNDASLTAISGTSASDIWAMGFYYDGRDTEHLLLYHYNGTSWSLAPAPQGALTPGGMTVISPTSVYMAASSVGGNESFVYHYNGTGWSVYLSNVPINYNDYNSVLAGSSGTDLYGIDTYDRNGVDHWDGTAWSHVGMFNDDDGVRGVAEGPAGTIWSDGEFAIHTFQLYVAENGARQTNPPSVMTQDGILDAIATGSGLVIAVGGQDGNPPNSQPIVVMSCD